MSWSPTAREHTPDRDFRDNDGSSIDATSYTRIDEIPITSTGDYVSQTATSGTSYLEFTFSDTTAYCVQGVMAELAYHSDGTLLGGNDGKTAIRDGVTESVINNGDMSGTSLKHARTIVGPASAPWSRSAVNGLVVRLGYSSDASPNPRWDAVVLEYDRPL